ncbi:MAG: hypothetical protein KIS88_01695 [Anaerolineales bacterium]|nr:hypothetical protein [Anaerolineales bacterium]
MSAVGVKGNMLQVSADARVQDLLAQPELPAALHAILQQEGALEQPVLAHLAAAPGGSRLAAALLALDAELEYADGRTQGYGSLLALRASSPADGPAALRFSLLATLQFYESENTWLALARWPSGRTRVAVGGWGAAPILAMDGRDPSGILEAAENALMLASDGAPEDVARMQAVRQLAEGITLT